MSNISQSHYMAGSPLNRLSWLRTSSGFLSTALGSPKAKWVVFYDGRPLIRVSKDPTTKQNVNTLAMQSTHRVSALLGPAPYFAQGHHPGDKLPDERQTKDHDAYLEANRLHGPGVVFLGTHEPNEDALLPSSEFKNPQSVDEIRGEPFFALDVTSIDIKHLEQIFNVTPAGEQTDDKIEFADPRSAGLSLNLFDAAIFSESRTMVDWNARNKCCTGCGSRLYSLWGGWKLSCSSLLPWADNQGRAPCPTGKGLHNVMHPRTDPVIITVVLDETGDRILLGRNKRFPPGLYSALAGFLEPGESFEEAVTREIYEESGVRVTNVQYHSAQPWPFPANLLIGYFARADSSQKIRTDLDNELEDARWFTRNEILEILAGGSIGYKENEAGEGGGLVEPKKPSLRVPDKTAMAGVLIWKFAHGEPDVPSYPLSK